MIIIVALLLLCGTLFFGSCTLRMAVPLYGLGLLLGVLWALKLLFVEAVSWKKSLMHFPVAGFAIYAFIRYCTSPLEYESRVELFQIGVCTLLYFVSACNFYHRRDRTILLVTLIVLGLGESIFAIGQLLNRSETIFGLARPDYYFSRGGGTFFNPNHLAGFLEMVLGLAAARLALNTSMHDRVQKVVLQKIFLAFGTFLLMVGLTVTFSRGGWLSALLSLSILLLWGEWKWGRLWPRILVAGIGLSLMTVLAFQVDAGKNRFFRTYIAAKTSDDKPGKIERFVVGPRMQIWKATVTMIREHPLAGTGGGTWEWIYPKYRPEHCPGNPEYAHNDLLNVLSDYGLIGFALMAVALTCFYGHAYGLSKAKISAEERSFAVGSAMAVTALLVHSLLDFNLHMLVNAALFMTLIGFTVAMQEDPEQPDRVPMSRGFRYALALGLLVLCGLGGWFIGRSALAYHFNGLGDYAKTSLHSDEALDWYQKALKMDSHNAYPYAQIGRIYLNQSHWRVQPAHKQERLDLARQAIGWFEKALQCNPFHVDVINQMARAYDVLHERDQVIKYCDLAMALDPQSLEAPLFLARFYMHENDLPNAEKAAMRAAVLNWGVGDPAIEGVLEEIRSRQKGAH